MKKEFLILLQLIIIAGLVGGFFYLAVTLNNPESMAELHNLFLKNWIYSFIGLSLARFGFFYLTFREESYYLIRSNIKYLLKEISKSIQYLIIAVISIYVSFYVIIESSFQPGFSINTFQLWYSMEEVFLGWLVAFSILSLLRLAIIYTVNIFFTKDNK